MTKRKLHAVKHGVVSSGGFGADKCCSSVNRTHHDLSPTSLSKEVFRKRTLQLHRRSYNITNRGRRSRGWHSRKKGVTLSENANESFSKLKKNTKVIDERKCIIVDLTVDNQQEAHCRTKDVSNGVKRVIKTKQSERHDNKDVNASQSKKRVKKSSTGSSVQTACQDISSSSLSDEFIVLDSSSDEYDSVVLPPNDDELNNDELYSTVLHTTPTNEEEYHADVLSGCPAISSAEHDQM